MPYTRHVVLTAALAGMLLVPALADAQGRGRAVRRGPSRAGRSTIIVAPPYRPFYYRPYRPGVALGLYYGYPWYGGSYAYGYGYPYGPYGYGYGYPSYGYYGRTGYAVRAYGGVRIAMPQRDAEVYVDGYYAGVVDDFDGTLQQVNLEPGPHNIEVRADGFEPVAFDVNVEPGRTITYRAALRPARP
ncbi:MAG TPA: PEGA domain-containing protein [Vicinamibacterales bacterium]|nr:PEGA domain-containing protein [Vicinamibacterales bacterium]